MRRLRVVLAALAFVAVGACNLAKAPPPPVLGQVPEFHLVGDDGGAFNSAALAGKSWLASFLFTSCPGPCPRLVEKLKTLRTKIPASDLAFVSFSVDPVTDTPAVLAQYKRDHGIAASAAWTFVTGPEEPVLELVRRGFLIGVDRAVDPSGENGAVMHGVRVALIDGDRRIRGFYDTESADDLVRLEQELGRIE